MTGEPLTIAAIVLRDSTALVPVGMVELLRKSLALRSPAEAAERPVEVLLVGQSRSVATSGGLPVRCDATFADLDRCDVVVVPALDPGIAEHLHLNRAAVAWVADMHRAGADVCSACTGAFVLGEAGLLDGHRATTHWAFQGEFASRYPLVDVQPQAIVVDEGRVCTAGGATSFINLAHYLVERLLGPEVAFAASRMFLIDVNKAPQGAYAIFGSQREHADAEVLRAQTIIEGHAGPGPSVTDLAGAVGMSPRTLSRRFRDATGNSPQEYLQRVRIERAKRALETGRPTLTAIAAEAGYRDPVAFRRMFTRLTGMTPAEYRRRYGPHTLPGTIGPGSGRPMVSSRSPGS